MRRESHSAKNVGEIRLYRLVKKKWAESAFDGEGAKMYGGRWNSKGRPCVYMAENPSLAILEVLVHMGAADVMRSYVLFEVQVPISMVMKVPVEALPSDWSATAPPPDTASFGDGWLDSMASVALAVPSVLSPDWNYLMNVNHPTFEEIVSGSVRMDFEFDTRFGIRE